MGHALLSIHDVMPETLDKVRSLADLLVESGSLPCALLVVPGCDWTSRELDMLRELRAQGFDLAGHGWLHKCVPVSLRHKLHSLFFSRNVAEHLALDSHGIETLLRNCHKWFTDHDFVSPTLYVPPAWAMGRIARARLRELPFEQYEFLWGIYDALADRVTHMPVVGFEADTLLRTLALRPLNAANRIAAGLNGHTLRISVHPHDLENRLATDLRRLLNDEYALVSYADAVW
jgi:predicted deacetylase